MKLILTLLFPALLVLFSCSQSNKGSSSSGKKVTCIDESKIRKDQVCIEIYAPVCGCDGKTYPNSCIAENSGVTAYTQGECR